MPTVWSPPKTPQFLRSGGSAPPPSTGLTVETIPQVNVEDLVAGTGEWNNLQKIIRFTFKSLIDSVTVQHGETGRLQDYIKHLSQTINSKVDKRSYDEMRGDVMRACTGVAQLQEDVRNMSEGKGGGDVQQRLEAKVDRFQWETHRSEMASKLAVLDMLDKRTLELDAHVRASEARLEAMVTAAVARQAPGTEDSTLALSRRVELLQSELCRLARVVDHKAERGEVEAALKLKASKVSVQKRLVAVAEEDEGVKEAVRKLKSRVEALEGALDGVGRRSSEAESALRRVSIDVEAMRGRPRSQDSAQSVTSGVKALEGLSYQTAKKTSKLEKEMSALAEKLSALESEVGVRPTQAMLEDMGRAVNEGVKSLEDDIFKELDARDEEMKQRNDETMHLLQQLEEKVGVSDTAYDRSTHKAEPKRRRGEAEHKESLDDRVTKLEARCELLTPERVAGVVSDALRDVEASKLVKLTRRGEETPTGVSVSFKDVLRRLDNLDFDVAHAGMLFKVLQEVVCDALGALEGTMLQHMGTWADDSQRRLTTLETRLEHDAIRRLEALQQELRDGHPITTQHVQELIEEGVRRHSLDASAGVVGEIGDDPVETFSDAMEPPRSRRPSLARPPSLAARSLFSQRSRTEAFDPQLEQPREDGEGVQPTAGDDVSAVTGPTRRGSTDRRVSVNEGAASKAGLRRPSSSHVSRLSQPSTSGSRQAEGRTPTPRGTLAGLVDLEAGGGGEDFQEIVLRRLDLLEREMEKMQEEQGGEEKEREADGQSSPSLNSVMVEQRLNTMETALHNNDHALGDVQDQLLDAKSQLRGLRLDHDQTTAGLAARVQAVEERVARGVLSMSEDRAALEHAMRNLQTAMERLKEDVQRSTGPGEAGKRAHPDAHGLGASNGGRTEAMRRLEEQVVACQEQIQSRMASLKTRMEQPIEGFAQAVAVMSQDLQNVKRSIAQQQQQQQRQQQQQEQSDGRSAGGRSTQHQRQSQHHQSLPPELSVRLVNLEREGARSTHALEARIATLEHEASTLSSQLRHVTNELYTVNREVERLVAVSPVPLPPLPRASHAPSYPTHPRDSRQEPPALYSHSDGPPPQDGREDGWRAEEARRSRGASQATSTHVTSSQAASLHAASLHINPSSHAGSQPPTASSFRRSSEGHVAAPGADGGGGGGSLATQTSQRGSWMGPPRQVPSSSSSFSAPPPRERGWSAGREEEKWSAQGQPQARPPLEREGEGRRGRQEGLSEQRSNSSVSEVTMHSMGTGTKPPRPLPSRLSRDRRPEAGFGGGEIREEDEEDEEVRTASDSAMHMRQQHAHFQEPQPLQGRRPMSHSRGSATSSLGQHGTEGALRVDSALSHAGFESVNQGRLSQLSGLDGGGSMSSAVSQQEQQLESIRREKERLASLIPQLHNT